MAIGFTDITSQSGGIVNILAGKMEQVRKGSRAAKQQIALAESMLAGINAPPNLDGLPTVGDISGKLSDIRQEVDNSVGAIADVSQLTGSCLDGAVSAINAVSKDALSVVQEGMLGAEGLGSIVGMPAEIVQLTEYFGAAKETVKNLGLDKIIGEIYGSLGCLADGNPLISDITNELNGICSELGLSPTGAIDDDEYTSMMDSVISAAGLDTGPGGYGEFMKDSLDAITKESSAMADAAKESMKSTLATAKNSLPRLPTPPEKF